MAETPLYVGIDLGTTNSAAAVFDGEQVVVVRNAQGGTVTPSVVRIDKQSRVTVGARARRFVETDPNNTATEFKRLMGTNSAVEFPAAGLRRSPEALSAEILRALRSDIADQVGVAVDRAVISVPALFELPQSSATSEAARLAGFSQVELLQEPIASALAAGWRSDEAGAQSWLVFDLGGGTFDASLLETRDGLLRVVGHDGDNFLGGRDFDWAITEHLAAQLSTPLLRRDPSHAAALRMLRLAAEDAKIELSRSTKTAIALAQPLQVGDFEINVDLELSRDTIDRLCVPLVDRAIDVCRRLLDKHGLTANQLGRMVLVGGPTVMPFLRNRVAAQLEVPFAEGHDPMTLVAQGAAIFAATAGLDGRARSLAAPVGRQVWLQYPAVSADLTPHVVGRFLGDNPPATVKLLRADGGWQSPEATIANDGSFIASTNVVPRRASTFELEARDRNGTVLQVSPSAFTIVQGLTIGDPPLSRTLGVALANGQVHVYLERGSPLPARRTFTHHTVETVAKGSAESLLRIPIVQGEMAQAHLCRLVGTLDISGERLRETVVTGTPIEVTIELDRGGAMSARAMIPGLDQVFEHVAHLLVPEASPAALDAAIAGIRKQLTEARTNAFRHGMSKAIETLANVERQLSEAERDIDASHGGDLDAGQRARRTLIEIDGVLADVDLLRKWPELESQARSVAISASGILGTYGNDSERSLLQDVLTAMEKARKEKDAAELERQIRLVQRLQSGAYNRSPEAWESYFANAASEMSQSRDVPAAQRLVNEGKAALAANDTEELRRVVRALWNLMPDDPQARARGFDSGVR